MLTSYKQVTRVLNMHDAYHTFYSCVSNVWLSYILYKCHMYISEHQLPLIIFFIRSFLIHFIPDVLATSSDYSVASSDFGKHSIHFVFPATFKFKIGIKTKRGMYYFNSCIWLIGIFLSCILASMVSHKKVLSCLLWYKFVNALVAFLFSNFVERKTGLI